MVCNGSCRKYATLLKRRKPAANWTTYILNQKRIEINTAEAWFTYANTEGDDPLSVAATSYSTWFCSLSISFMVVTHYGLKF